MLNLFHGIRLVAKILTASLFLFFIGCSSDSLSNGDDMSFAKSATGSLLSKAGLRVQMQDDFDGKAQNFTVQFFINNRVGYIVPSVPPNPIIPPPIALGNITPVGEILWTIGGNTQRRLVSIYDGSSITGVAEHFAINATDNTDLNDSSNQTQYDVTITGASGVRGSTSLPPTYQTYIDFNSVNALGFFFLTPTQTFSVPIPQNAGVTSVMITANSGDILLADNDFNVRQVSTSAGDLKVYNPLLYSFVPLSPQADQIFFENFTPLVGGKTITFSVTWGIDG